MSAWTGIAQELDALAAEAGDFVARLHGLQRRVGQLAFEATAKDTSPGNGGTDTAPGAKTVDPCPHGLVDAIEHELARFADGTTATPQDLPFPSPDCGHVNVVNSRYVCKREKGHPGLHCDSRNGPGAFWFNADVCELVEPLPEER